MSILIKGMNLPKEEVAVIIYSDGEVRTEGWEKYSAVEVPEHGRLIDADAFREDWLYNGANEYVYNTNSVLDSIDNEPTVIPADEEEVKE